jgi:fructose-1,6-bisphosphatase
LGVAQPKHQPKEDRRNEQNVNDTQPVQALEYEEQVIEKLRHGFCDSTVLEQPSDGLSPDYAQVN